MITGSHSIIYSKDPEADRAFMRDILGLPNVDPGGGWLIFGLPPSEVAIHPSERNSIHELYLMCDNIDEFIARMREMGISCTDIQEAPWGRLTAVHLPGGGELGVYQPLHERPPSP